MSNKRQKLNKIHWSGADVNVTEKKDSLAASREDWVTARKNVLDQEKDLSRAYDAMVQARREMPWLPIDITKYNFTTDKGISSIADMFDGKKNLVVQHLMFSEEDTKCCSICSYFTDGFNGQLPHIIENGVSFYCTSPASLEKLNAVKDVKKWGINMASCNNSDFNLDMGVEGTDDQKEKKDSSFYNYGSGWGMPCGLYPGLSVFFRDDDGKVYLTYQAQARGMDVVNGANHLFDMLPQGRNGFFAGHKECYDVN